MNLTYNSLDDVENTLENLRDHRWNTNFGGKLISGCSIRKWQMYLVAAFAFLMWTPSVLPGQCYTSCVTFFSYETIIMFRDEYECYWHWQKSRVATILFVSSHRIVIQGELTYHEASSEYYCFSFIIYFMLNFFVDPLHWFRRCRVINCTCYDNEAPQCLRLSKALRIW